MDLLKLPARWLAGPAAAVLGVEGRDRRERAATLRTSMTAPVADEEDLLDRHLARFVMWWLLGAAVLPAVIVVQVVLNVVGRPLGIVSSLAWGVVQFAFWMGIIHAVKACVVYYLPEGRWKPGSRLARIALLDQAPDLALALAVTVVLQIVLWS